VAPSTASPTGRTRSSSATIHGPQAATCHVLGDWWILCLPRVPDHRKWCTALVRNVRAGSTSASARPGRAAVPLVRRTACPRDPPDHRAVRREGPSRPQRRPCRAPPDLLAPTGRSLGIPARREQQTWGSVDPGPTPGHRGTQADLARASPPTGVVRRCDRTPACARSVGAHAANGRAATRSSDRPFSSCGGTRVVALRHARNPSNLHQVAGSSAEPEIMSARAVPARRRAEPGRGHRRSRVVRGSS
jgi:hypothetical protein